jgi:hypothetical protein
MPQLFRLGALLQSQRLTPSFTPAKEILSRSGAVIAARSGAKIVGR